MTAATIAETVAGGSVVLLLSHFLLLRDILCLTFTSPTRTFTTMDDATTRLIEAASLQDTKEKMSSDEIP